MASASPKPNPSGAVQRDEGVGGGKQAVHLGAAHRPLDEMDALVAADRGF